MYIEYIQICRKNYKQVYRLKCSVLLLMYEDINNRLLVKYSEVVGLVVF